MGYATKSGISISIDNMIIPQEKPIIIKQCETEIENIKEQYTEGLITDNERYNNVITIWSRAAEKIANKMMEVISKDIFTDCFSNKKSILGSFNPLYIMANSGARGSDQQ